MVLQLPATSLAPRLQRRGIAHRAWRHAALALGLVTVALATTARAQSVVLTEAFSDPAGRLHFAVTKVLHVEGAWLRHPLEVGTIIDPPSARRAYPLRRFGETVLFVLPKRDNLRAYWSYNVHDGFVPAAEGRTLAEVISLLVPATPVAPEAPPAPLIASTRRYQPRLSEVEQEAPAERNSASHELMAEALRELTKSPTPSDTKISARRVPQLQKK